MTTQLIKVLWPELEPAHSRLSLRAFVVRSRRLEQGMWVGSLPAKATTRAKGLPAGMLDRAHTAPRTGRAVVAGGFAAFAPAGNG